MTRRWLQFFLLLLVAFGVLGCGPNKWNVAALLTTDEQKFMSDFGRLFDRFGSVREGITEETKRISEQGKTDPDAAYRAVVVMMQKYSSEVDSIRSDLLKLTPPPNLRDLHKLFLDFLTSDLDLSHKGLSLMKAGDKEGIQKLSDASDKSQASDYERLKTVVAEANQRLFNRVSGPVKPNRPGFWGSFVEGVAVFADWRVWAFIMSVGVALLLIGAIPTAASAVLSEEAGGVVGCILAPVILAVQLEIIGMSAVAIMPLILGSPSGISSDLALQNWALVFKFGLFGCIAWALAMSFVPITPQNGGDKLFIGGAVALGAFASVSGQLIGAGIHTPSLFAIAGILVVAALLEFAVMMVLGGGATVAESAAEDAEYSAKRSRVRIGALKTATWGGVALYMVGMVAGGWLPLFWFMRYMSNIN